MADEPEKPEDKDEGVAALNPRATRPSSFDLKLTSTPVVSGLSLRKIEPSPDTSAPRSDARVVRIDPIVVKPERAPQVFETVRVIDLLRLRMAMRRQNAAAIKRGIDPAVTFSERLALLQELDRLHAAGIKNWPDVVVVRRPETGPISTNFALIGEVIYLGSHLSPTWAEGQESPRFFVTLLEALSEYMRVGASHFEPVGRKQ